jgi:plastocyanin
MNHKIFPTLSLLFLLLTIITSSIDSSFFFLFYKNTDNNNYYSYHYHLAYAADGAKSFTVMIPKGSANPEVDITKLGPRQWYLPRQITVHTNDTITWKNNDTESHTVTSGVGAGIESLMSNKRGTPNGIFDSSTFKPGQSWTHTFTNPGTYTYFCTIHPWMEGVVSVQGEQAQNIPKYPVDATGKRIFKLPVYHFTSDGNLEVGLSWDPTVLLTGKDVSFFVIFFDRANNKPNLLLYDFILMQNGKQLERIPSISQVGMNVQHFAFSNSGPTTIRIENIGGAKSSFTQFNTIVYDSPSISSAAANQLAAQYQSANSLSNNPFRVSPITLVYIAYAVIFGIPAAVAAVYFLYRRGMI